MSFRAKYFILCFKNSSDSAHQCSALASEVGINFFAEISFKQIPRSNTYSQSDNTITSATSGILINGKAAVDSFALQKQSSYRCARSFGSSKYYINILRRNNACLV